MYHIRVGHLIINLEYLILAEDAELEAQPRTLPEGVLRLTLESGRVLDLRGGLADLARRQIDQVVSPFPVIRPDSSGHSVPIRPMGNQEDLGAQ